LEDAQEVGEEVAARVADLAGASLPQEGEGALDHVGTSRARENRSVSRDEQPPLVPSARARSIDETLETSPRKCAVSLIGRRGALHLRRGDDAGGGGARY
jgi:hypothetical protein